MVSINGRRNAVNLAHLVQQMLHLLIVCLCNVECQLGHLQVQSLARFYDKGMRQTRDSTLDQTI